MGTSVKPIVLVKDDKTMLKALTSDKKKQADVVLSKFECELTKDGLTVVARRSKFFGTENHDITFSFDNSVFEKVEEGRSAGKAAVGAIAGGVLLGPLGMLAGAAMGGTKMHRYAVTSGNNTIVVDVKKAVLAQLVAKGVIAIDND